MASSLLFNRAKMSTATTGTGTITLGSAVSGFDSFADAGVGNGNQVSYLIEDGSNWEYGTGTYTSSGTTLTRTVIRSSSGTSAISLSGGAQVSLTALSQDLVTLDGTQTLTNKTLTSPTVSGGTINSASVGATTPASGAFTTLSASSTLAVTGASTLTGGATVSGATNAAVNVTGDSTGAFGRGYRLASEVQSSVTTNYYGYYSNPSTAASVTLNALQHFSAVQGTFGAGTAITNQYGLRIGSGLTGATNNYGIASEIASGSNRWNVYASGTADNAFAGNTRFGGTTAPTVAVDVTGAVTATGAITGNSISDANGQIYPLIGTSSVATTSGTTIDINNLPSWTKRVIITFSGVSLNTNDDFLVQLGTGTAGSPSFASSGYVSTGGTFTGSGSQTAGSTAGMLIRSNNSAYVLSGQMFLTTQGGNVWISGHNGKTNTDRVNAGGGNISLAAALTQIRLTTVGGTATFDAGAVNIQYEG